MKFYHQILLFSLLAAIAASSFSSVIIQGAYQVNKSYIATVKCENRDKPTMHCNGKCYLKNQLKQEEEKRKEENVELNKFYLDWISERHTTHLSISSTDLVFIFPQYLLYTSTYVTSPIDPPPCPIA
ncbi:MAG: hypothetical protein SFW35_05655 [Chitinophagales bacterium]|nr:hypothetical protein [Chitinophagales bacterium]